MTAHCRAEHFDTSKSHTVPYLVYALIQMLLMFWGLMLQTDPSFAAKWVSGHIKAAQALGKPLLLEEVPCCSLTLQSGACGDIRCDCDAARMPDVVSVLTCQVPVAHAHM